ncbi:MAG: hypothetical protein WC046_08105, partial [Candidatus Bathyarchaeia archaeon]
FFGKVVDFLFMLSNSLTVYWLVHPAFSYKPYGKAIKHTKKIIGPIKRKNSFFHCANITATSTIIMIRIIAITLNKKCCSIESGVVESDWQSIQPHLEK